jgi:Uma2 family endonuclease
VTFAHDLPRPVEPGSIDQFVCLHGVSFLEYEALLQMRGDSSVPRITYLRGELELMTPSRYHENDKKRFARLLEAWAEETGTELEGVGSWTLKNSKEERGAEPDECYTVGRVPESDDDRPDLAIEVIWSSGGINKLEVYRKLAVREVWIYERGTLRFFALRSEQYEQITRSEILPGVEPDLFIRCMAERTQAEAVRALRRSMQDG